MTDNPPVSFADSPLYTRGPSCGFPPVTLIIVLLEDLQDIVEGLVHIVVGLLALGRQGIQLDGLACRGLFGFGGLGLLALGKTGGNDGDADLVVQ